MQFNKVITSRGGYALPLLLMILATAMLIAAPLLQSRAFVMRPGTDGALTVGIFGCLLALLHGWSFRRVLMLMAPLYLVQLIICFRFSVSPFAFFGTEFMVLAFFGAVAARLQA